MPKPPEIDGFEDIKFITNYFLMGCVPPTYVVVDFSKEPLADVAMLICTFDWSDIAQEAFQPGGQRNRRSGRHGRKGPPAFGSLDPNEVVGAKIRAKVNPTDFMKHSPLRRIFPVWNAYEGVAFTAAVAEGFTDVGFESLWGMINVSPNHCREFARFSRQKTEEDGPQTVAAAGPPLNSFNCETIDFVNGFVTFPSGAQYFGGSWAVTVSATLWVPPTANPPVKGRLAIGTSALNIKDESGLYDLDVGDTITLNIGTGMESGETALWGLTDRESHIMVMQASAVGYKLAPIFQ
jgi:hypothetical protein